MVGSRLGRVINVASVNGQKGAFARPTTRGQGRHPRLHQGAGAGSRQEGVTINTIFAGLHRHQDGDRDPEGNPRFENLPQIPVGRLGKARGNRRLIILSLFRKKPRS